MEWSTNLGSRIVIFPSGEHRISRLSRHQNGMSWVSKYAYIGVTSFHSDIVVDGMNEKGLSFGVLWFPDAKYPTSSQNTPHRTINLMDLGSYFLGSFSSIDELRAGLKEIQIQFEGPAGFKNLLPPLHFTFHDRSGKSLAVEFINGEMLVLDNPSGVLTNMPKLEWQLTNLRNYINLSAINQGKVTFDGTVLDPTGQGSGLHGMPGDWTPPSRFVRIALLKQFVEKASNSSENVNLAFHLLNTVDIPFGAIEEKGKKVSYDFTQWVVVKDLEQGFFYYRTYGDLNIEKIDFFKLKREKKVFPMKNIFNIGSHFGNDSFHKIDE